MILRQLTFHGKSWQQSMMIICQKKKNFGRSAKTLSMIISMILSGRESIPTDTVPKIRDIFWRRSYENGKKIRRNSKILIGIIIINT